MITTTPRLALRRFTTEDLDITAPVLMDPDVTALWPRPYTRDEVAEWIEKQLARYDADGFGYWLGLSRRTGEVIGLYGVLSMVLPEDFGRVVGLGWITHRPHWRMGYATEGAAACRDWAFEHGGMDHLHTIIRPENTSSIGVAHKLGMTFTGRTSYANIVHDVWELRRGA
ncbi:MAG: GNAT family N-acetyltransferase [Planctomycetota bacterium]